MSDVPLPEPPPDDPMLYVDGYNEVALRAYAAACRADERRKTLLEAAELAIQSAEEHERSGEDWRLHAAGGLRRHAHELRALADQPNTKEQA